MEEIIVSFCIASYKRWNLLRELIEELLALDEYRFEIVVCDDQSNDGTLEKLNEIKDERLKVYINDENVGGMVNIYKALECGRGKYIFYINDRDQVDAFKVGTLINILTELEERKVAFARCIKKIDCKKKYEIYRHGKDAFLEFSCGIYHPTGYLYNRAAWDKIPDKIKYFGDEYGDYGFTILCSLLSINYEGAYIYGDMCDVSRERIDFSKERSRFNQKRKDKCMWYSVERQYQELQVAYRVSNEMGVESAWCKELLLKRYDEYLRRVTLEYESIIHSPSNTTHYGKKFVTNPTWVFFKSMANGLRLWRIVRKWCKKNDLKTMVWKINEISKREIKDLIFRLTE